MAIDPSIALQVKPLRLDPLGDAEKSLTLKKLLIPEQMRGAFVFDDSPEGPQMNLAQTRRNLYNIDPQSAMAWDQQQALQQHWQGQRQHNQMMLLSGELNRRIKQQQLGIQAFKAGVADISFKYNNDPREPDVKAQDYFNAYKDLQKQFQQYAPVGGLIKQGLLPEQFDPDALSKFVSTPDTELLKVNGQWASPNAMTDEGDVVSPEYYQSDAPEQEGEFSKTAAFDPSAAMGIIADKPKKGGGGGGGSNARERQIIEALKLQTEANNIKGTDPASIQRKNFLLSSANSMVTFGTRWTPDRFYMFNAATGKWDENKFSTGIKEKLAKAGAIGLIEKEADKSLGKSIGGAFDKELADSFKNARASALNIANILDTKKLVDKGIYTGKFAKWQERMVGIANAIGMEFDKDTLSNTQAFLASVANQLLPMTHLLGTGNGFTNTDRDFLYQVLGGDITNTDQAIKEITTMSLRAAMLKIKAHNEFKDQILEGVPDQALWSRKFQVNVRPELQREVDRYLGPAVPEKAAPAGPTAKGAPPTAAPKAPVPQTPAPSSPKRQYPQPPAQAITDLRKNPSSAAQFDEVFGPGAAKRVLGK